MIGIFSAVGPGGVLKNIGVADCDIYGGTNVTALAATVLEATIENCWVIGGNIGARNNSIAPLTADVNTVVIKNCYANGTALIVSSQAGGLAVSAHDSTFTNCYAASPISSPSGGGFISEDVNGVYTGCFWDETINAGFTGIGSSSDPAGLVGKSTTEMQQGQTYIDANWDIVSLYYQPQINIWRLCTDNVDYPHLAVEYSIADFACPDGIGVEDLAMLSGEWMGQPYDLPVDLNVNYRIDLGDWVIMAKAFNSIPGDSNWNPKADLIPDNFIDLDDVNVLIGYWLEEGVVNFNADIYPQGGDDVVNFLDFAEFSKQLNSQ